MGWGVLAVVSPFAILTAFGAWWFFCKITRYARELREHAEYKDMI